MLNTYIKSVNITTVIKILILSWNVNEQQIDMSSTLDVFRRRAFVEHQLAGDINRYDVPVIP